MAEQGRLRVVVVAPTAARAAVEHVAANHEVVARYAHAAEELVETIAALAPDRVLLVAGAATLPEYGLIRFTDALRRHDLDVAYVAGDKLSDAELRALREMGVYRILARGAFRPDELDALLAGAPSYARAASLRATVEEEAPGRPPEGAARATEPSRRPPENRIILVAAASPTSPGVTTIAANLACHFAREGRSVGLLDLCPRHGAAVHFGARQASLERLHELYAEAPAPPRYRQLREIAERPLRRLHLWTTPRRGLTLPPETVRQLATDWHTFDVLVIDLGSPERVDPQVVDTVAIGASEIWLVQAPDSQAWRLAEDERQRWPSLWAPRRSRIVLNRHAGGMPGPKPGTSWQGDYPIAALPDLGSEQVAAIARGQPLCAARTADEWRGLFSEESPGRAGWLARLLARRT